MKTTNKSWNYQAWFLMLTTAVLLSACQKNNDAPLPGGSPYGYGSPCYGCAPGALGAVPAGGTIVSGVGQILTTQSLSANFALRFFTPTGTVGGGQIVNNIQVQGTMRIIRGDQLCNIPPFNGAAPADYSVTRTINPGTLNNGYPKTITGLVLEFSGPAQIDISFPEIAFNTAITPIMGFDGQQYPFTFGYDPVTITSVSLPGLPPGPPPCASMPMPGTNYFLNTYNFFPY